MTFFPVLPELIDAAPPAAFPRLPASMDLLPSIPGGWVRQELPIEGRVLQLMRPADPDLFLDDAQVHDANARNDYMPYWAFLWPSATKMAAAILRADWPAGTAVLELGAGLGLAGLAALQLGAQVTMSDYDLTALHVARVNARLNGFVDPDLLQLDWRHPPAEQFPVLIGCEVTYDAATHSALLTLIDRMLLPTGECWLGDPGRYQSQTFYDRALQQGFRVRVQDEHGQLHPGPLSNEFQIFRLDRASTSAVRR